MSQTDGTMCTETADYRRDTQITLPPPPTLPLAFKAQFRQTATQGDFDSPFPAIFQPNTNTQSITNRQTRQTTLIGKGKREDKDKGTVAAAVQYNGRI